MKKPQVLILAGILIAALAGGGYYYYTTTPGYALAQAKAACAKNDIRLMGRNSVAHINNETRLLSDAEIGQMVETIGRMGSDCPYDEIFAKKATMTSLDSQTLQRLGVEEGLIVSFEGEDESKSIKLVKFGGRWRFLLIEVSQTQAPTIEQGPQIQQQPQVEFGPQTAPPPAIYQPTP